MYCYVGAKIRMMKRVWWLALACVALSFSRAPAVARSQAGDTTPPTVVNRSVAPGATNVSTQVTVRVTFSEPVLDTSIAFTLKDSGNVQVPAVLTYDSAARTAVLDPVNDLSSLRTYTATVAGATDLAGNPMSGNITWTFTTANAAFRETTVFSGLTNPTAIEFASDGRVFVAEKSGLIKVFASLTATAPTIFADLRTQTYDYWDRGLLGLALDPAFPRNLRLRALHLRR